VELRHVRTFLVLAEELHFGRTASRMHLAQSAVSQTIKALEAEVGATLFVRTRRSVALSSAGESFRVHASGAITELERAEVAARRAAAGQTGRLVVGMAMTTALTVVPRAIAAFRRERPNVEVTIVPGGSAAQIPALRNGTLDVGFMAVKEARGLELELVHRSRVVAALPVDHPLAGRKTIALERLAAESFVFLKRAADPPVYAWFAGRCREHGFEPKVVLEVEEVEMLLACVASGLGVTCVPENVVEFGFPGLSYVPIRPAIPSGIAAVWNPERPSEAARRLLELVRAERRT
jgi:DNA-binding transcriptional LysR family regulator